MLRRRVSTAATAILPALLGAAHVAAPWSRSQDAVAQEPSQVQPSGSLFDLPEQLDLSLEDALRLALQNNLGLQLEDLTAEAALYAAKGSWGAFDWRLGASGGVTDTEFESENVFAGSMTNTQSLGVDLERPLATTGGTFRASFDTANTETDNQFSALGTSTTDIVSVSYVQPLLRGAWRQYATSQQSIADMAWRRTLEHRREVRNRLLFDVANAYWDLVAARDEVIVADSSLALARTQLEQDQRRLDAGVGTQIDVVSAEAQVATREEIQLAARVLVRQRGDALRLLILPGSDAAHWEVELVPGTPLPETVSSASAPSWGAALQTALAHRAELRQQQLLIDELELTLDTRRSEVWPQLDLSLSASSRGFDGKSREAFDEAIAYDFPTYSAFLNFSFPLGNRSASNAERGAWVNLRAAILAFDDLESLVASQVREALRQVAYQAEAVRAARKSLDLARRQLEAEQKRHEEGISTNFQVLSFQQDLTQALSNELHARAAFAKALTGLASAQGLIGEDLER